MEESTLSRQGASSKNTKQQQLLLKAGLPLLSVKVQPMAAPEIYREIEGSQNAAA